MRALVLFCVTALGVLSLPADPISAQSGPAVEIRGGLNLPLGEFSDSPGVAAESDAGFAVDLIVPVNPRFSAYGGVARDLFGCEGCGGSDKLRTTGLEAGVKFLFRREGSVLPWVRAGAVYHKLTIHIAGVEGDSDWGLGFQAAAGADIPLGEVLSFSPALRYQTYAAEFQPFGLDFLASRNDVSFLSLDFGVHIHLRPS